MTSTNIYRTIKYPNNININQLKIALENPSQGTATGITPTAPTLSAGVLPIIEITINNQEELSITFTGNLTQIDISKLNGYIKNFKPITQNNPSIEIKPSNISKFGTKTTIEIDQQTNHTYTIGNFDDDEITLNNAEQTLTNKTCIDEGSDIAINSIKTNIPNTLVTISNSAPPIAGQVITATSGTNAEWQNIPIQPDQPAESLATTGEPVIINLSPPPTTGQILIATSPTNAKWDNIPPATQLATNNILNPVTVNTSAPPIEGQILIATLSGTDAIWQYPTKLATNDILNPVTVNTSAPIAGQVLTATSGTNATWQNIPASVFGSNLVFQQIIIPVSIALNDANPVNLTPPFVPSINTTGTYVIIIDYQFTITQTGNLGQITLTENGTQIYFETLQVLNTTIPAGSAISSQFIIIRQYNLTGNYTFTFNVRRITASLTTINILNRQLLIYRIA